MVEKDCVMEGFIDCSQMMRGGVYVLKLNGEIIAEFGEAQEFTLNEIQARRVLEALDPSTY